MGTITRNTPTRGRIGGRIRPRFDALEYRMALSGSSFDTLGSVTPVLPPVQIPSSHSLSILSTSPANSSVLASSPTTLLVSFDRELDSFTVLNGDFKLVHVADDGSTSPLGIGEAQISESLDPSDSTGRRVELTLSKGLVQGRYQLFLNGDSQLQGLDGSTLGTGASGRVLSDFRLSPPQTGLGSAIDLQTLGSNETVVSGLLNLSNDPGAVQYDKFTLGPGHHWRVGLEISAHRDGSTLDSTLSLFDAQGHLISTSNEGLSGDPGDPYLFQGLDPGVYYVGISAKKNIPDASGAYHPSQSVLGSADAGGPYRLHLVADPADQPTQLLGLRVDHADPLSTNPTGLTLQFSAGLAVNSFSDPSHPALTLIDQSGKSWPITPVHYDSAQGQLSLVFSQALAPGTYTLRENGIRGLVDLAGLAPVTPGLAGGVLGSFQVTASIPTPGDLGAILPGMDDSGLKADLTVSPDQPTTVEFVITQPGLYVIDGVKPTGGVRYSITDGSGNVLSTGPGASVEGSSYLSLTAGTYRLVFSTANPQPATVSITIRLKQDLGSSLLDGGVAQGPALGLRLISPQADFGKVASLAPAPTIPSPSPVETPSSPTSLNNPGTDAGPARSPGPDSSVSFGQGTPFAPTASGWLYQLSLAGRPSPAGNPISVVGTSSGMAALASNEVGLPGGLMAIPVAIDGGSLEPDAAPLDLEATPARPNTQRVGISLDAGLLARSARSRLEDDRTLEDAAWIDQVVARTFDLLEQKSRDVEAGTAESPTQGSDPLPARDVEALQESRVESASFTSPIGIGLVLGAFAYHFRGKFVARPTARTQPGTKLKVESIIKGPHQRSKVRV